MKLPPYVYIRWHDACVPSDGSVETPKADCSPLELHAIGWYETMGVDAVRIGMEFQVDAETSRSWQIIPLACIKDMRVLELPPTDKKRKHKKSRK